MVERDASVDPTITTEFDERISPPPTRPQLLMSNPEMISRKENANFDRPVDMVFQPQSRRMFRRRRRERKKVISPIIPMSPMAI